MVAFSGPEEARTEAITASVVEWYQPVEERSRFSRTLE
jgi:hypothetical protein